ncbi:MAG: pyridoxal phosphate-dependent aminotransferase [Deltaproteobacteria bacterium]|nr:pyridoxal phosphate-dependent aminotransferase [Deltaproteobacteria bacterium]
MRLSHRALSMQESAIRKLDQFVVQAPEVHFHKLNIGQPDVATPIEVMNALAATDSPVLAYGPASGLPACRKAAAAFHSRTSPGLGWEHCVVTQGGSEALLFAFCALCDPGDEILVPEPYYTNYNGFATVAAAKVVPVRTRLDEGFRIPSNEELDRYVTDKTRIFLFANPGNPTGAVYGEADLRRVAEWARSRGLWLVADEVYREIWFTHRPVSALELEGHEDHVLVVDSTSKTFSSCGLRIGFLISRNLTLMERVERLGQARLGAQPRAQNAAIAALALGDGFYDELRAVYRARVDAMMDALAEIPGVSYHRPEGAFYTMARLPVNDTEAFARFLVTEFRSTRTGRPESVVVAPGPGFYANPREGRDEIRLAAVKRPEDIRRGIEVIGEALAAFRG